MRPLLLLAACCPLIACADVDSTTDGDSTAIDTTTEIQEVQSGAVQHGRDVWFENDYGGGKFFAFLKNHPDPAKRIDIGFANVVNTPRAQRFDVWGVINDPDCVANPAGGADLCDDPEASGVVGIRKHVLPNGAVLYGTACASCHAGFDPLHPPDDPNEPEWSNIHATIGNGYLQIGKLFAANLAPTDPRGILFASWPPGSVDTTLLFDDGIMNPGVITAFWEWKNRPHFDVGLDKPQLRNGQGGEDDLGPGPAAIRVYTNIGVCFQECTLPAMLSGQPIDVDACRASCADFPPEQDLNDLGEFLATFRAPRYPGQPNPILGLYGRLVFDANCESCHDRSGNRRFTVTNDEVNALVDDPANATNACRALTTNWETGKLWAEFSSQVYKDRVTAGKRGYRTMPLAGIWSTSPLLHNQSIGPRPPADAAPWERAGAYWDAMWELLSPSRPPVVLTLPVAVGPFPAGTPLHYVFSRNAQTGAINCTDLVENKGHYYGANLGTLDKIALIYWLQYQ
jgi:cytochrome c5